MDDNRNTMSDSGNPQETDSSSRPREAGASQEKVNEIHYGEFVDGSSSAALHNNNVLKHIEERIQRIMTLAGNSTKDGKQYDGKSRDFYRKRWGLGDTPKNAKELCDLVNKKVDAIYEWLPKAYEESHKYLRASGMKDEAIEAVIGKPPKAPPHLVPPEDIEKTEALPDLSPDAPKEQSMAEKEEEEERKKEDKELVDGLAERVREGDFDFATCQIFPDKRPVTIKDGARKIGYGTDGIPIIVADKENIFGGKAEELGKEKTAITPSNTVEVDNLEEIEEAYMADLAVLSEALRPIPILGRPTPPLPGVIPLPNLDFPKLQHFARSEAHVYSIEEAKELGFLDAAGVPITTELPDVYGNEGHSVGESHTSGGKDSDASASLD